LKRASERLGLKRIRALLADQGFTGFERAHDLTVDGIAQHQAEISSDGGS